MVKRFDAGFRQALRVVPMLAALAAVAGASPAAAQSATPTFSKDIAPILQRSCQRCHKPDSVAPMALLTYEQVRPYAREIKRRTGFRHAQWSRGGVPPGVPETDTAP